MMKYKVAMLGLAMMIGLSHVTFAMEWGDGSLSKAALSEDDLQLPKHGADWSMHRLMDRLSIPVVFPQRNTVDAWQMEFVPPPSAYQSDDPLTANDKRVGVTFKLDF
jgi:hypothetical protein